MGDGEVTLKNIADAVGKSVATVSKALRNHPDIAPGTRALVKQVAGEMGYRPNVAAQRLQKKRADALGLILPLLSARQADPFFTELLSGVADEAASHDFDLLVLTRPPGPAEQTAYRRLVAARRVDGVIVAQPRRQDWRLEFLTAQGIPFVGVGHFSPSLGAPGVWIDAARGLQQAVAHLAEQGRSRLALIPPPDDLRFAPVCRQAFRVEVDARPGLAGQTSVEIDALTQKEGYRAAQILLAGTTPPDAIIACHDLVAMGAMAAAQDQGFEIGNDLAVVGFGDILLAEHAQPPLTSLHQPTYAIGQQACRMMLNTLAGNPDPSPQVIIEPWLVIRQSSSLALWL